MDFEENKKVNFQGDYVKNYESLTYSRLQRLLPLMDLSSKDDVCDYACGNGMLLDFIHSNVGSYCGVDFSNDFIESATQRAKQRNYSNYRFVCSEILDFCRTNTSRFTKAFAFDFTGYLSDSELLEIMNAIRSSLKENGLLYIHIPDGNYFIERIKSIKTVRLLLIKFGKYIPIKNHQSGSGYRKILIRLGFKDVEILFLPHYNFMKYLHFLRYIPLWGKYFNARLFISCRK
jgi:SAM-dependent methyltransferase